MAQYRGLDPAVGKIKTGTVVVTAFYAALPSFPPVAMLDLRRGKLHGSRIAMQGQAIDDRSARIAETEQLRDLVECLAGSIVSRVPDILVRPAFVFLLGEIEMRVSSRDHQSQHWKHQFVVSPSGAPRGEPRECGPPGDLLRLAAYRERRPTPWRS